MTNIIHRLFNKGRYNNTGIYRLEGNHLIELEKTPGDGSINSIVEELGFNPAQVHTVRFFYSKTIQCVGVKVFTDQLVFVIASDKNKRLNIKSILQEIKHIDWKHEYSEHFLEGMLHNGIDTQSFSLDFFNSILKLEKLDDKLYLAPTLQLYLYFNNGCLENFTSSEWTNSASKWLQDVNKEMFDGYLDEAMSYHNNEIEAMEEVNLQCESIRGTPHPLINEFVPLHTKTSGNVNFYNLLAAHYNKRIHADEFKSVNKGRYTSQDENTLKVGKFIYQFDIDGFIIRSTMAS